ncbi:hypothetical protein [Ruminococcus sp. XPD3002]|uniref:hypothetical protein n=1 Tax=Ruminococcus sp. XPD3002 TaxID=1452269 RepID=UPI000923EEA5|nr:hypothetical protein [Ruminococcus sp.]SFX82875.1 hypothetical protein SAMN04487832_11272 [Ruminococcus flavefaciens]HRU97812.1 hypothetical protein [Ruminococcus sp.]
MLKMNESMHRLYDQHKNASVSRLHKIDVNHAIKKLFKSISYEHGCILTGQNDEGTIASLMDMFGDYTGAEAGANEFRIHEQLWFKTDFSDIVLFVDEFEKRIAQEYPKLRIETLLSVDEGGEAVFRFYQNRPEELEYCRDIGNSCNAVRINTLYTE